MAAPARPLELVLIALGQLAEHVAEGRWGPAPAVWFLERKARRYVELAEWPRGREPRAAVRYRDLGRDADPPAPDPWGYVLAARLASEAIAAVPPGC